MRVNGFEIVGRSVSGYATAVALPEYNLCFDCGMATHEAVQAEFVTVTHGHLDHFGGVARHGYIRGMTGMATPKYIVPPWLVGPTHQTFKFWADVQGARKAPYDVQAVKVGERTSIGNNRFLRPFPTIHRVKSQGYVLVEDRKRLKPEFIGTPGRELGRMRREGINFEDTIEVPLVAFTGDTEAKVLDRVALEAKVLFIECTFLSDVSEAEACRKGHVQIDQLVRRMERLQKVEMVVLYHFSKRYNNKAIQEAIGRLPTELRQKTTFLPVKG